ncbi:Uncharacterized protein Rs2_27787 [Raphanus sativus]|nr:Uncharacterized protein Rs2_27787 [Raphanus sativus]
MSSRWWMEMGCTTVWIWITKPALARSLRRWQSLVHMQWLLLFMEENRLRVKLVSFTALHSGHWRTMEASTRWNKRRLRCTSLASTEKMVTFVLQQLDAPLGGRGNPGSHLVGNLSAAGPVEGVEGRTTTGSRVRCLSKVEEED